MQHVLTLWRELTSVATRTTELGRPGPVAALWLSDTHGVIWVHALNSETQECVSVTALLVRAVCITETTCRCSTAPASILTCQSRVDASKLLECNVESAAATFHSAEARVLMVQSGAARDH